MSSAKEYSREVAVTDSHRRRLAHGDGDGEEMEMEAAVLRLAGPWSVIVDYNRLFMLWEWMRTSLYIWLLLSQ